jgi:hypothetical protein
LLRPPLYIESGRDCAHPFDGSRTRAAQDQGKRGKPRLYSTDMTMHYFGPEMNEFLSPMAELTAKFYIMETLPAPQL